MIVRSPRVVRENVAGMRRLGLEGALRSWRLVGMEETKSERIVFDIVEVAPGKEHRLHRHKGCEQLIYMVSGAGLVLQRDQDPIWLEEGDLVLVRESEWHGFRNQADHPVRFASIYCGVGRPDAAGYEELES